MDGISHPTSAAGSANGLERTVFTALSESLRVSENEIHAETELDAIPTWDSLSAVQLLTRLEAELDMELDPVSLFERSTPGEIVEYLDDLTSDV